MQVSDWHHFENKKAYQETQTEYPWLLMIWSEMISLCKKLNIIYNIITCNPEL